MAGGEMHRGGRGDAHAFCASPLGTPMHSVYAIIIVFPDKLCILFQFDDDDSLDDQILARSVADLPDTAEEGSGLQVTSACFYCIAYKAVLRIRIRDPESGIRCF